MKVLYHALNYLPDYRAGDSVNAHEIHLFLKSRGNEVIIMRDANTQTYVIDGMQVVAKESKWYEWADIVCTCLDFAQDCIAEVGHRKPIIFYFHNTFYEITLGRNPHVSIVFNSQYAKDNGGYRNDSYVLTPPVDPDFYSVFPDHRNSVEMRFITLINCNRNKGSEMVRQLAEAMPEERFLVVKGAYSPQEAPELPNVTVWDSKEDMRPVYASTWLLLMPSAYESWGRTATEAACSGIPVLSSDTWGLRENLGDAGIYCSNLAQYIEAINRMKEKKEYDKASAAIKKRVTSPVPKLEGLEQFMKKKVTEHQAKNERR